MPNSIRIFPDELREFKDWLIGHREKYKEEETKAKFEVLRMRSMIHGDNPIIFSSNTKNKSVVIYGGRAIDLWQEFISES